MRRNMVDGEYLNSSDTTSKEKKNMNSNSSSNTLDVVQLVLESQGICGFYDGHTSCTKICARLGSFL